MVGFDNSQIIFKKCLETCEFYNIINDFLAFVEVVSNNIIQHHLEVKQKSFRTYNYGHISSELTIKGIIKLCEIGDFVDAFVLLRKIRDNILLDYFFISDLIFNVPNKTDKSINFETDSIEDISKYIANYIIEKNNFDVTNSEKQMIEKWFNSDNRSKKFENTYKYSNYKNTLNERLNGNISFIKNKMDKLDRVFNDFTHSNGMVYLKNPMLKEGIVNRIDILCSCVKDLEEIFLIYAFYIDPLLLQSSDYIDCLDFGETPPEEYKYYIFNSALDVFERIKKNNPEYFEILKENNKYGMFIEKNNYK